MALGLEGYYGSMWYRSEVDIPAVPTGKKTYLWIPSEDGDIKVFVNGIHVPYANEKGESSEQFKGGFGTPVSFEITSAIKPNESNQITIIGTRTFLNELGTGGLMAPPYIYSAK